MPLESSRRPKAQRRGRPSLALLGALAIVLFAAEALAVKPPPRRPAADPAAAQEETAPASKLEGRAEEEQRALGRTLDRRHRFSKKWQSELGIFGGDYLGDEWLNTWDVGTHYYLHINNTFAIGASYFYSRIRANAESNFGASLTTKNHHGVDAEVMVSNDCAFRTGKTVIDCDLFMTLGAGATVINRVWEPLVMIGGGLKIYLPPPWIAIRFDVNCPLHPTPKPGGNSFNVDVAFNLGLSFLFPGRELHRSDESIP